MTMLVSLEEAKRRLRITYNQDDPDIELMIASASASVLNYLKSAGTASMRDSAGDLVEDSAGIVEGVTEEIKQATIMLVGYFYKDRDNDDGKEWEQGYLPRPVTAVLYPLRDPALR